MDPGGLIWDINRMENKIMNKLKEYKAFFNVDRLKRRIEKLEQERDEWRERCKKLVIENIGLQK
jgi:FtsZ-binding cell division protein ZapB